MTPVHHDIRVLDPHAHLVEVVVTVEDPAPTGAVLRLATWTPGSYMVREFARNVVEISAEGPVALTQRDKTTWAAAPTPGPLRVRAVIYAWELTVRTAHVDATHAFLNGTSVFFAVEGREQAPQAVSLHHGPHPACAGWRVATTLPRTSGEPWGFGTFLAADYDALIDHPLELGTFEVVSFDVGGVPHAIAVTGRHRGDLARLAADVARICAAQCAVFGLEAPPCPEYLFQLTVVGDGYGGLEHRSSTALIATRDALPTPGDPRQSDAYRDLLGLFSHEYFHLWNVKRIKPAAFTPYDLSGEAYTTLLWFFEGVTSYYDDLGLLRAGVISEADWLKTVGRTLTRVLRGSGRLKQSVAASSWTAWTKFYRQDENAPNAIVSYYAKGSLVAMALDLTLRARSEGRVSLDDLMRALWARHGAGPGVEEDGIERLAEELVGASLTDFFDLAVRGTDDLPLAELLAPMGLQVHLRAAEGDRDKGGAPGKAQGLAEPGDLGVTVGKHAWGAALKHVHAGGAAHAAGLSAGDVVVALDGLKVDAASLTAAARARPAGQAVTLHAFRRDELFAINVTLLPPPRTTAWIAADPSADADAQARRRAWLGAP